jgi:allophanate hydrolase
MIDLGVHKLAAAYRAGEVQPQQVLEEVYANIESRGKEPVWIALNPKESALAALRVAESRVARGPLFGIPFAVKDNIDVAGLPTTAGCAEFAYVPQRNAFVVDRLMEAGAIPIGKTNLDQFATGLVGTRSPYGICASVFDSRYISGGSSSGSAVAVARGDVSFALGTDTAGSGRVPAAFNGLVGLKPTRGILSTSGVVPACRSLDCVSIFAGSLEDAECVFNAAIGFDVQDPFSRKGNFTAVTGRQLRRIGVPDSGGLEFFGDSESEAHYRDAIAHLVNLGYKTVQFDLRPFRQVADLLYQGPWVAERLAALGNFIGERPEAVHPVVRSIIEGARSYSASDAFRAVYELARLRRVIEPLWEMLDAIVLPTVPTHYTIEAVLGDPIRLNQNLGYYTNFTNLLDLCALAMPAGLKKSGLPFGITWFAPAHHDRRLIEYARSAQATLLRDAGSPAPGHVWLAVAGAHLSGQPLNGQLSSRQARLVATTSTAAEYRLYALGTVPPKPGLVHTPDGTGQSIEVEVWELDERAFGSFVAEVPAPMTIGTTKLTDGSQVKGFCCEPHALASARDITHFGGWRQYLSSAGKD